MSLPVANTSVAHTVKRATQSLLHVHNSFSSLRGPVRTAKTYVNLTLHDRTKPQSSLRKTPPSKWNVLCPVSKCCFANPPSSVIRCYWDVWFHTLPSSSVLPTNNNAQNKYVWKSLDHLIKRNVICHYF